jgi:hypothetical protein
MKGKKMKKFFVVPSVAGSVSLLASNAMAAVDLTGITVDTATPEALTAIVLGGLAIMWGIRKLIKTMNRS